MSSAEDGDGRWGLGKVTGKMLAGETDDQQ